MIDNSSRYFCGIGGLKVDVRRQELGLEDNTEYQMWRLHLNRVFQTNVQSVVTHKILGVFQKRIKVDDFFKLYFLQSVSSNLIIVVNLSSSFSDMAANFYRRRDALLGEREKVISNIVSNLAHAVDKASLTAVPASSGDANTTTPSADTSLGVPLVQSKKSNKAKGKKITSSTSKVKRAHEGTEVEGPRKKSSQGPRLATVTESDETMS